MQLSINNVSMRFGVQILFEVVSATFVSGRRYAAGQFACSPGAIAPFHFNDGFDPLLGRSFEALLPMRVF